MQVYELREWTMSNVTDEFTAGPEAFLKKYVVQVANAAQEGQHNAVGVREFYFWVVKDTKVALREAQSATTPKIRAYWLPWKDKDIVCTDLGSDANYFFTSQMTGCRFSILTKEGESPKVAHIAGTLSKTKRNEAEKSVVEGMGGSSAVASRRLSVSDFKKHGYTGQTSDPASAFVYGVRDTGTGVWTIEAQIVKAAMTESVDLRTLPLPAIEPAFKFNI
jgi:hypothetical protein